MKLADVLKVAQAGGFLAADKSPEQLRAAIIAADKKGGKDAAGSGLGARELEEKDKAEDRARDEREAETDEREQAADAREAALDEREEAHDAAEEKDDEGKEDAKAKDRKTARDSRKGARDARKGARDARMGARDSRKGARDKRAKDRNDDPEHTNPGGEDEDVNSGDPSTPGGNRGGKQAVDSAEVDRRINAAVMARDALHTALREVEPILGTGLTYDSAPKAYRAALERMGVDVKGVHDSALPAMLKLAKDKAQAAPATPAAMDSAQATALAQAIPGYNRLP